MNKAIKGEVVRDFERLRFNRKGELYPVSISMAPLHDEALEVHGIVAATVDIREQKRVEQELTQKSATWASVTDALNTFL